MSEYKLSNKRGEGRAMLWLKDHVNYRYDDCLKWPFGKDSHGYGQLGHEGKVRKAHRVMCELVHGPAPSPKHEAAHSCNRGHQACINPGHIFWKTRSANQRDRTDSYGRGAPKHKLTELDIAEIRSLFASTTNLAIAKQFDVTPSLISKIKNGKLWNEGRKRHFVRVPDEKVREIKSQFGTMSVSAIAEMHGLPVGQVQRIKSGQSHGYVS